MKVLIIDVDFDPTHPFANLACMKESAWHKNKGDMVYRAPAPCPNPDKVFISCVFTRNRSRALGMATMFTCPVEIGGYAINDAQLPQEIEHIMPDYVLYGIKFSMGVTSRGCIRNCGWCIVPTKEGKIHDHAPIREFLRHKRVMLLDNNFLASPRCQDNLTFLIQHKIRVCFTQGLDIRLVDKSVAKLLAKTRYSNGDFTTKRLYFAFDQPAIEGEVLNGIQMLRDVGIPPRHLMFYVLVGFNTTFAQDYHRFEVLRSLGTLPYIMLFNDRKNAPLLRHFERYVNGGFSRICKWKDYDQGDSQKWIKSEIGTFEET